MAHSRKIRPLSFFDQRFQRVPCFLRGGGQPHNPPPLIDLIFSSADEIHVSKASDMSAGTTERIFEMKTQLYDVYVDNQNVTTQSAALKDLLKVSSADREKFDKLNNIRSVCLKSVHV